MIPKCVYKSRVGVSSWKLKLIPETDYKGPGDVHGSAAAADGVCVCRTIFKYWITNYCSASRIKTHTSVAEQ